MTAQQPIPLRADPAALRRKQTRRHTVSLEHSPVRAQKTTSLALILF